MRWLPLATSARVRDCSAGGGLQLGYCLSESSFGHDGLFPGYSSLFCFNKETGIAAAVALNNVEANLSAYMFMAGMNIIPFYFTGTGYGTFEYPPRPAVSDTDWLEGFSQRCGKVVPAGYERVLGIYKNLHRRMASCGNGGSPEWGPINLYFGAKYPGGLGSFARTKSLSSDLIEIGRASCRERV